MRTMLNEVRQRLGQASWLVGNASSGQDRFWRWLSGLTARPEHWCSSHRLLLGVVLAAVAFATGVHGWRAAGVGMPVENDAELAHLQRRVDEARAALVKLPVLRSAAAKRGALADDANSSRAAQWQAISSLAARSGVALQSLEPGAGARSGDGVQAARHLRIVARASFAQWLAFLQGLPTLPSLVVPTALRVERADNALAIEATLRVYEALPAGGHEARESAAAPDETLELADPFGAVNAAPAATLAPMRLLGVIHGKAQGLAMFETETGLAVYESGQALGAERIVGIDAHGVTLASREGRRVLTFPENAS
jgi:hypothetical protein